MACAAAQGSTLSLRFCCHRLKSPGHFLNKESHIFILPLALQIRAPVLLADDTDQSSLLCLCAEPAGTELQDKQAGPWAQAATSLLIWPACTHTPTH